MTLAVNIASLGSPMSADSSGNVGVGATPPTSDLGKSITINTAGNSLWSSQANQTDLLANATYNGGWKFVSGSSNYANRISVGNANGQYAWQTSSAAGTSGNAITFNQLMTLNTNGVLGLYGGSTTATGVGIAFPATQSASNDANTLDDYEEGTWSVNVQNNGSTSSWVSKVGYYRKVGSVVTCWFACGGGGNSNGGSGSGAVILIGLPFSMGVGNTIQFMGTVAAQGATNASGYDWISSAGSTGVNAQIFYNAAGNQEQASLTNANGVFTYIAS